MMSERSLTHGQQELLILMLDAERQASATLGRRDTFSWHAQGGMGPSILLHSGVAEGQTVDPADMEELIDQGLLQRTGQRAALLSNEGITEAERLQRAASVTVDVSWDSAEHVLQALWTTWSSM
jgi:hypothetical protein